MPAEPTPPRLPDRATAWGWLASNLLVLPGLGSVMGGKRIGYAQMTLAVAGFGLTGFWFISFLRAWATTQTFPFDGGPHLLWGLLGVALFVAGWCWAFATSLRILRAARKTVA